MRRVNQTAKPRKATPRRRPASAFVTLCRRAWRPGLCVAAAGALFWSWHSGWLEAEIDVAGQGLIEISGRAGLSVGDVLVEGRGRTGREAILAALGVERDTPILSLDPVAARERLEALPWVALASVERRLPDTLYLRLVERRPMALWQRRGEVVVIDSRGEVIEGASPGRFAALPLVVGDDAADHARDLLIMLSRAPDLERRVTAAIRVGRRRWNLRLDQAIEVRLPERDAVTAFEQLAQLSREQRLLERHIQVIDLRLPDRLVVRMAPDAPDPASPEELGEST